jgi:hypothetical protein
VVGGALLRFFKFVFNINSDKCVISHHGIVCVFVLCDGKKQKNDGLATQKIAKDKVQIYSQTQ